jgi:hypothetical protein
MGLRWTIYSHTHVDSQRRYVGLTKLTIMKRWNQHLINARSKRGKGCAHFWNAIRKYGKDAFTHEILEICDTLESANLAEEKWINHFNTRDPQFGFNLAKGGEHKPHPIRKNPWDNPEYREKMIGVIKAKWQDPEYRAANLSISKARLAEATRISSLNKVQSRTEVRQKLSEIMKRIANTPDGRAQRAAIWLGKVLTPEHRAKISKNNATKRPEVLAKMSASGKAAWADLAKHALPSDTKKTKRPRQTHCKRGHAMEEGNIITARRGGRSCRMCVNIRRRNKRNGII